MNHVLLRAGRDGGSFPSEDSVNLAQWPAGEKIEKMSGSWKGNVEERRLGWIKNRWKMTSREGETGAIRLCVEWTNCGIVYSWLSYASPTQRGTHSWGLCVFLRNTQDWLIRTSITFTPTCCRTSYFCRPLSTALLVSTNVSMVLLAPLSSSSSSLCFR